MSLLGSLLLVFCCLSVQGCLPLLRFGFLRLFESGCCRTIWHGVNCYTRKHDITQAAGWGTLKHGRASYPDTLQWVSLPVLSNADCANAIRRHITQNMTCAGRKKEVHKDTCQGDSGGPLTTKRDGIFELVGLTSWGLGCANGTPGVYTRVTKFVLWVADQIKTL